MKKSFRGQIHIFWKFVKIFEIFLSKKLKTFFPDHNTHWTDDYHKKRFGAIFFDYTFKMEPDTSLSISELAQIENWDRAKEQSFKRIFIPSLKITFPPIVPDLITKLTKWTRHDYQPGLEKWRIPDTVSL